MNSNRHIELTATRIAGSETESDYETKADYLITEVKYINKRYRGTARIATRGLTKDGMFQSESFMMFGGYDITHNLEDAPRYNQKRLTTLAALPATVALLEEAKAALLAKYQTDCLFVLLTVETVRKDKDHAEAKERQELERE